MRPMVLHALPDNATKDQYTQEIGRQINSDIAETMFNLIYNEIENDSGDLSRTEKVTQSLRNFNKEFYDIMQFEGYQEDIVGYALVAPIDRGNLLDSED